MLLRWYSTVFTLRNSDAATSALVRPCRTASATWSSPAVRRRSTRSPWAGADPPLAGSSARAPSAQGGGRAGGAPGPGGGAEPLEGVHGRAQVAAGAGAVAAAAQPRSVGQVGARR